MHVGSRAPTVRGPTEPLRVSIYIFHIVLNTGSRIQRGRVYIRLAQRILLLFNSCTGCKDHVMHVLTQEAQPADPLLPCGDSRSCSCGAQLTILRPPLGASERDASQPDHCVDHKLPLLREQPIATIASLLELVELSLCNKPPLLKDRACMHKLTRGWERRPEQLDEPVWPLHPQVVLFDIHRYNHGRLELVSKFLEALHLRLPLLNSSRKWRLHSAPAPTDLLHHLALVVFAE
mmetsp:Transcript_13847/g.30027  ORF Transcript_13847/g.30027 Transcript_13847/m.30027 type:complete len:234 (+) Transcript_13847:135-836(+)